MSSHGANPKWTSVCVRPPPLPPLPFLMIISVLHHHSPSWARLLYMQLAPISQPNPHLSVTSASEYGRKHSGWLTRSSYGSEDFPSRGWKTVLLFVPHIFHHMSLRRSDRKRAREPVHCLLFRISGWVWERDLPLTRDQCQTQQM